MTINFDRNSLKFKIWTYFILFALLIIITLWFLQVLFLNNYYQDMKIREVNQIGSKIAEIYRQPNFVKQVQDIAFSSDMDMRIESLNGTEIFSTDKGALQARMQNIPKKILSLSELKQMLLTSGTGTASFIYKQSPTNDEILLYGKLLPDTLDPIAYLYVFAPLSPVESTIAILKNQLIYVSIILLLLAFGISILISGRISRPIQAIAKEAEKLADGKYDVVFHGGNFSEIDKLAVTLNNTAEELAKTDMLQKDLIANVSHDLRTPLTLVKSYAEMIRDLSGNDAVRRDEHLKIIIDEADRLSLMVDDLLALAKIQSGIESLTMTRFNVLGMIGRILKPYRILQEQEGYSIQIDCRKDLKLRADERRIEQVLSNLISNAVKYSSGKKMIRISAVSKGQNIRFEISDTGKGIPSEELENIWDRYYKAEGATQHKASGSGLGLAIVREILELHKAQYGISSILDKGSIFWFELKK